MKKIKFFWVTSWWAFTVTFHALTFFFLTKKRTLLTAAIQTIGKSEFYNLWLQKPWIAIFRQNDLKGILHLRRAFQNDVLSSVLLFWGVPCRGCSSALLLDETTGSPAPLGGPCGRGEPGWRQLRVAAGQQNRGLAGLTPRCKNATLSCAALTAVRARWLSQIQQTHFLQPHREAPRFNRMQLSYSTYLLLQSFKWK